MGSLLRAKPRSVGKRELFHKQELKKSQIENTTNEGIHDMAKRGELSITQSTAVLSFCHKG